MKFVLKVPGTMGLKPHYDTLLSTVAFKFTLRRYSAEDFVAQMSFAEELRVTAMGEMELAAVEIQNLYELIGRGLHSSSFRVNVSALCGSGGAFRGSFGAV
jgi:hypothetical protein